MCKRVIGFVFRLPGVFGDKCGVPVFQMKKREPGMVFAVLYYNISDALLGSVGNVFMRSVKREGLFG